MPSSLAVRVPGRSREQLEAELTRLAGRPVSLTITDNRVRMVSFGRRTDGTVQVRLHRMFLDAPETVVRAVSGALGGRQSARGELRRYIAANRDRIRAAPPRRVCVRLDPSGRCFDLVEVRDAIRAQYLPCLSPVPITWGRRCRHRRARRVRLGWYDPSHHRITISRRLDTADIPRYMVEYVVYHELLHAALGVDRQGRGGGRIHNARFRQELRRFAGYARAQAFEKQRWG